MSEAQKKKKRAKEKDQIFYKLITSQSYHKIGWYMILLS